jgi:glycosyltransferase involved in cell wall biosynthesis
MRIAVISTPFVRVPPRGYGGTELFCGTLAEALMERGHDVTLFATGDSEFSGDLRALFPEALWPPSESVELAHIRWALHEISRAECAFDAVQMNSAAGLPIAGALGIPVAYTLHHHRDENLSQIYAAHPGAQYVAISARQLELETPLPNTTVIHHGVDPRQYPTTRFDRGYVLHLGRYAEEKGTHLAIDAAFRAGIKLVMAGRCHEKDDDRRYYAEEVLPRLQRGGVDVAGEADHEKKVELLGGARALLCPIGWEEPFGLIAIEAMLMGTPVVGFSRGSFPEIIDEGITGRLVSSVDEMARAVRELSRFDRRACAARARQRFSAARMAAEYESFFRWSLRRTSSPHLVASAMGRELLAEA